MNTLSKYLAITKLTIAEYMTYRMNFFMWRMRQVVQILVLYFLWLAFYTDKTVLFGYTEKQMLTYILMGAVFRTVILSTTTYEIANIINDGKLANILLKPIQFFRYYISRDAADKLLNVICSVVEITTLLFVLRPPLFFQTDPVLLTIAFGTVLISMVMFFFFSIIFGLFGFWSQDVWSSRFLSLVIIEFFSGGMFPLDILPKPFFVLSQLLPFSSFIYFPVSVYLGKLTPVQMVNGVAVGVAWTFVFWIISKYLWRKGLSHYEAQGR